MCVVGNSRVPRSSGPADLKRVVVDLVGEPAHGLLAESRFVERPFLPGGEHNMYELAFAAVANGFDVELRGWLERGAFERLADAVGSAPRVGLPPRLPQPDDLVVVPEGWRDPLEYGRLLLSPARLAVFVLAPPGLFGWPFTAPGWTPPDPLTVPLDAVAKAVHFQAMHELGFSLLTHSPGLVAAAEAAGVPCAFVGTGRPALTTPPHDVAREVQVTALTANRWAPLVDQVVRELDGVDVDLIGETSNQDVLTRFGQSQVLLWPSRIEGHATVPWEARSVGCVPVALSTNRFAVGLSEETGAVLVDRVDQIAPAVRALLADERRWHELSKRARRSAISEVRWDPYADRVGRFLGSIPAVRSERGACAGIGAALDDLLLRRLAQSAEVEAEEQRVRLDRDGLAAELAAMRRDRDRLAQELLALRERRAVQIALRLAALRTGSGRRSG
jgi:hypothetical protein